MNIVFDGVETLQRLAATVRVMPEAVDRAAYRSINTVAAKVQTDAIRYTASQLNLKVGYIRDKFKLIKAGPGALIAQINAEVRPIGLENFAAKQLTTTAKRAKGDSSRAIPAGRKAAGVSVKVAKSGGRKNMPGAFLLPLRAGKVSGGNGTGLFIRVGNGTSGIKHEYGPSPDQVFRRYRTEQAPDIQKMLAETFAGQLRYELTGSRR